MAADPYAHLWSKGAKGSQTKQPKKGIGGRAKQEFFDLLHGLRPDLLGKAILKQGAEVSSVIAPGSEFVNAPIVKRITGQDLNTPQRVISQARKKMGTGNVTGAIGDVLQQMPVLNLVPGTYAGGEILKGQPLEHPLYTVLDVLPLVGKASKVLTKGGSLAGEAAERAAQLGKVAKAERIAKEGLLPRQAISEGLRAAEGAVVKKFPQVTPFAPSRLIEASGLGGERLRAFMTDLSVAGRKTENEMKTFANESMAQGKRFGVEPERVQELTRMSEKPPAPQWRDSLPQHEKDFIDWFDAKKNDITDYWIKEGKLFRGPDGEIYSMKGNRPLYSAMRRAEHAQKNALKAEQKVIVGIPRQKVLTNVPTGGEAQVIPGRFANRTSEDWLKEYSLRQQKVTQLAKKAVPARYEPVLRQQVVDAMNNFTSKADLSETDLGLALDHYLSGKYQQAGKIIGHDTVQAMRQSIKTTWQDLRDAGVEPVYLPHAGLEREVVKSEVMHPRFIKEIRNPAFTEKRSLNMKPAVDSMQIGVAKMGIDHIRAVASRELWPHLRERGYVYTRDEAIRQLEPMIERDVARLVERGQVPDVARQLAIDHRLKQMFGTFDPSSVFPVGKGGLKVRPGEVWFMPKGLHRALTGRYIGLLKQADLGLAAKIAGAPMQVFRLSILGLSPSYYLGNLVSGALMTAAHAPGYILHMKKAINMLRTGEVPVELSIGWREGTIEAAQNIKRFSAMKEIQKALDLQDARNGLGLVTRQVGRNVVQIPHWLNNAAAFIDDMYKVSAFLSGEKSALKKGLSEAAARDAGVELAHKVLVNFDRMTPLERTAIRSVVPFYSWTSHLLRYVFSYPFDHPVRAAVITALSRDNWNEWPEDLPEHFKTDLLFDHNTKRYPLTNYMPWIGVPDLFKFAGLFSRLNPAIQNIAEVTGADPYSYAPPVYGARQTEYDPVTGRRVGVRPSIVGKITELSPQLNQLWVRLANDPEWEALVKNNPEAARARLWRSFGIPIPRSINIQEEVEKARKEMSSQQKQDERLAEKQTGGDPYAHLWGGK